MSLRPGLRRLLLTAHLVASVGWLGSVGAFLAVTAAALAGRDPRLLTAVYLLTDPMVRFAIVPLALGSLATGVIQALATPWGLTRYYWVLFKFILTVLAVGILLQYTRTVADFASIAALGEPVNPVGLWSYLLHGGGGLLVLLLNTVLGVYKPPGLTPWAHRSRGRTAP